MPRTMTHLGAHNIDGMEDSRATCDGLLALAPNIRPLVLTRASYAGGQRYVATWTGDNLSTWNHLRQPTPQLLNFGLSAFSLSDAGFGGFGGSPSLVGLSPSQVTADDHIVKPERITMGAMVSVPYRDAAQGPRQIQRQGQNTATTVPVPAWPGEGPYAELVLTTMMPGAFPDIALPDLLTELEAITPM